MSELLYAAFGLIAGWLLKDYFPGYARKKGENLATKEDIEAITEKVESVKASVSLGAEREKQFIDKKQQLLLAYYDEITQFYYELLAVNFGDFPSDSGKSLYEYQVLFKKNVAEILKAYQRLVIFLPPNSQLLKLAESIAASATDSAKILKKNFGKVKVTAIKEQQAFAEAKEAERLEAVQAADEANHIYWSEMKPIVEAYRDSFNSFLIELNRFVIPTNEKA
ncbi:MAG: hypothetical protein RPU61_01380 [Candidatus Sedimenticola sp. (ex Thyasira tokunagai)]